MKLTTQLDLATWLIIRRARPVLPLYAFLIWTGTTTFSDIVTDKL